MAKKKVRRRSKKQRENDERMIGNYPRPHPVTGRVGKPPGRSLTALLKRTLDECPEEGISFGELLIEQVMTMALNGNEKMIKEVFDRVEGRPTENMINKGKIEHTIVRKSKKTPVKKKKSK